MSGSAYEKVDHEEDLSESDNDYDSADVPRTSEDVRRHDRETIAAEEEAERLLGRGDVQGSSKWFKRQEDGDKEPSRRQKRRQRRRRRKNGGEESELMYEMEEGGQRSSSTESSGHSSEIDMQRLREVQARQTKVDPPSNGSESNVMADDVHRRAGSHASASSPSSTSSSSRRSWRCSTAPTGPQVTRLATHPRTSRRLSPTAPTSSYPPLSSSPSTASAPTS